MTKLHKELREQLWNSMERCMWQLFVLQQENTVDPQIWAAQEEQRVREASHARVMDRLRSHQAAGTAAEAGKERTVETKEPTIPRLDLVTETAKYQQLLLQEARRWCMLDDAPVGEQNHNTVKQLLRQLGIASGPSRLAQADTEHTALATFADPVAWLCFCTAGFGPATRIIEAETERTAARGGRGGPFAPTHWHARKRKRKRGRPRAESKSKNEGAKEAKFEAKEVLAATTDDTETLEMMEMDESTYGLDGNVPLGDQFAELVVGAHAAGGSGSAESLHTVGGNTLQEMSAEAESMEAMFSAGAGADTSFTDTTDSAPSVAEPTASPALASDVLECPSHADISVAAALASMCALTRILPLRIMGDVQLPNHRLREVEFSLSDNLHLLFAEDEERLVNQIIAADEDETRIEDGQATTERAHDFAVFLLTELGAVQYACREADEKCTASLQALLLTMPPPTTDIPPLQPTSATGGGAARIDEGIGDRLEEFRAQQVMDMSAADASIDDTPISVAEAARAAWPSYVRLLTDRVCSVQRALITVHEDRMLMQFDPRLRKFTAWKVSRRMELQALHKEQQERARREIAQFVLMQVQSCQDDKALHSMIWSFLRCYQFHQQSEETHQAALQQVEARSLEHETKHEKHQRAETWRSLLRCRQRLRCSFVHAFFAADKLGECAVHAYSGGPTVPGASGRSIPSSFALLLTRQEQLGEAVEDFTMTLERSLRKNEKSKDKDKGKGKGKGKGKADDTYDGDTQGGMQCEYSVAEALRIMERRCLGLSGDTDGLSGSGDTSTNTNASTLLGHDTNSWYCTYSDSAEDMGYSGDEAYDDEYCYEDNEEGHEAGHEGGHEGGHDGGHEGGYGPTDAEDQSAPSASAVVLSTPVSAPVPAARGATMLGPSLVSSISPAAVRTATATKMPKIRVKVSWQGGACTLGFASTDSVAQLIELIRQLTGWSNFCLKLQAHPHSTAIEYSGNMHVQLGQVGVLNMSALEVTQAKSGSSI
jgi:hypothetical protein